MRVRPCRAAIALLLLLSFLAPAASAAPVFGTHTDGAVYDGTVDKIDSLQRRLDRRIEIVHWYQQWTNRPGREWVSEFRPELFRAVLDSGRTPLISWEPWDPAHGIDQSRFRLARIAAGAFDGYVESWARGLARLDRPVYLRPMHEMNGDWYPWGVGANGNSAEDFRAAWRHLHDIFEREGADNVRWVWCVNNWDVNSPKMERLYPGSRYVDVLSADGYNWGSLRPEFGGWTSFKDVFATVYQRLRDIGNQPIWIAEVGSVDAGGDKGRWVRSMFDVARRWDQLAAVVWFDVGGEQDWRAGPVADAFRARR